jgi:hypothetical protein
VRTNQAVALGLTQQQWISIALFVLGGAGAWWFGTHGEVRALPAKAAAKSGASEQPAPKSSKTKTKGKAR